jgi:DNA polymerase III epsilon subunit-like protein
VVELAIVTLVPHAQGWKERSRWSTLIRPTVPIAPEARACHHLSDAELADKWTMQELLGKEEVSRTCSPRTRSCWWRTTLSSTIAC